MRRSGRRWWTRLVTVLAVLIVAIAALGAVFRIAVNAVPGYRSELEAFVSRSVGHPAQIGSMALTMRWLQPTLELRDVALLDQASGAVLLEARQFRLGFGVVSLLRGGIVPNRIEASGIQLDADIDADGRWTLRGFELPAADTAVPPSGLARFATLRVRDSTLLLHDARLASPAGAEPLRIRLRAASIEHRGQRYLLSAEIEPPAAIARELSLHASLAGTPQQRRSWQGQWQLSVQQIAGWPWLARLLAPEVRLSVERGSLRASGTIAAGRVGETVLDLQLGGLTARRDGQLRAQLGRLNLHSQLHVQSGGAWRADIDQLSVTGIRGAWDIGGASLQRAADADGGGGHFQAGRLRLDDLAPWLALLRGLPPAAARLRDLHGDAESIQLWLPATAPDATAPAVPSFSARLRAVGVTASGSEPGFSGLEAQLDGSLDSGRLTLDGSPLRILLPALFERDLAIESLRGALRWQRLGDGWHLDTPALALAMLGTEVEGSAALQVPEHGSAPMQIKLALQLHSADVAALKPLMPKTWGPGTRAWLNRSLTRARVTHGSLSIDGALTPRASDGRMTVPWQLDLDLADGELDYAPGWPAAHNLEATLHFHDDRLDLSASSGELSGNRLTALTGTIADFHGAGLVLDGSLAGDGADLYRLLRNSPLKSRFGNFLERTEASGPVAAEVHLRVPLDIPNPPVQASGMLRFDDAELKIKGLDQPLQALRGRLGFGADGVSAEALAAKLYDTAITARIKTAAEAPDGVLLGEFAFQPEATGGVEAALIPPWLLAGLGGQTTVHLRLPFSGPGSGELMLSSDLRGISSRLPPPLTKTPAEPLALKIGIGGDARVPLRLAIQAGDALQARLRFVGSGSDLHTRGVGLRIGPGATPPAEADGLVVVGAPAVLDLDGWAALLGVAQAGSEVLPFIRADLSPARLVYRNLALGKTHLLATPAANGAIGIRLDGAASGQIDWLPNDSGAIRARLQRAAFEALPTLPAQAPAPAAPAAPSPFDPGTAPQLDIDCASLSIGDVDLGHLALVTARIADGQRIDRLQLGGGKLVVDGHGSWRRRSGESTPGSMADLSFTITSTAIADVLRVFGYAPNLRAKEAQFSGQLAWPRVPAGLELAQAEGEVQLDVKRGNLRAVDPGAGRVLGLINLYALPRRLLFDFRDVVSEGLSFDSIKGGFTLAGGNARTDDLVIAGPQAKITVHGRIGLAARDYDEQVTVTPDISTGVTVGATLLGGPIGGGIALVAQQLFGKPFNRLARFSYRVTGTWDNPQVIKGAEAAAPPPKGDPNGANNG